jgi:hypothetical protein
MNRKTSALTLILGLLFSAVASVMFVGSATADPVPRTYLPKITINSNGSITPETGYVSRVGNFYTLTADIIDEYSIGIERSNIVFDGTGHIIDCFNSSHWNYGLELMGVTNVTVRNLEVYAGVGISILLQYCSKCTVSGVKTGTRLRILGDSNTIAESNTYIHIFSGKNNLVTRNNLTGIFVGRSSFNIFSQNNILFDYASASFFNSTNYWDNGSFGNYWSDYQAKYPNASEIDNTGIGDTPYVIDADNVDYFPLMYPYDIEKDAIAFPTPEPQPDPESFPTLLVTTASAAAVAVVGLGLLVYFKKRKRLCS